MLWRYCFDWDSKIYWFWLKSNWGKICLASPIFKHSKSINLDRRRGPHSVGQIINKSIKRYLDCTCFWSMRKWTSYWIWKYYDNLSSSASGHRFFNLAAQHNWDEIIVSWKSLFKGSGNVEKIANETKKTREKTKV